MLERRNPKAVLNWKQRMDPSCCGTEAPTWPLISPRILLQKRAWFWSLPDPLPTLPEPDRERRNRNLQVTGPALCLQERIRFLHQHILSERLSVGRALRRSAIRHLADRAAGAGTSYMQALLRRLPGGGYLSSRTGSASLTCLGCRDTVRKKEAGVCNVSGCTGVFCRTCFHSLGNICAVCVRPLTSPEDGEEELDSSDDEQLTLRSEVLNRSDDVSAPSEVDLEYQDRFGSSDSDSDSD